MSQITHGPNNDHPDRPGRIGRDSQFQRLYQVGAPFDRGDIAYDLLLCGQPPGGDRIYQALSTAGYHPAQNMTVIIKRPPEPSEYLFRLE
jgi:hypothetical protein